MKNIVNVGMEVDQEYIKDSVTELVRAAIVNALGDPAEVVKNAVGQITDLYVDVRGVPCSKGSWHAKPFLEWLAEDTVRHTIREEMIKAVENDSEEFRREIRKQICDRQFQNKMVTAFLDCLLNTAKNNYRMPINVSFDDRTED